MPRADLSALVSVSFAAARACVSIEPRASASSLAAFGRFTTGLGSLLSRLLRSPAVFASISASLN